MNKNDSSPSITGTAQGRPRGSVRDEPRRVETQGQNIDQIVAAEPSRSDWSDTERGDPIARRSFAGDRAAGERVDPGSQFGARVGFGSAYSCEVSFEISPGDAYFVGATWSTIENLGPARTNHRSWLKRESWPAVNRGPCLFYLLNTAHFAGCLTPGSIFSRAARPDPRQCRSSAGQSSKGDPCLSSKSPIWPTCTTRRTLRGRTASIV